MRQQRSRSSCKSGQSKDDSLIGTLALLRNGLIPKNRNMKVCSLYSYMTEARVNSQDQCTAEEARRQC